MFTKVKTSKLRAVKCIVTVLALVAVLAFCLTACGKAAPTGAEYVAGTLAKSEYNQGETFDCTGAQIKITYDNGATEIIDVTAAMVGNVQLNTVGTAAINVTYSTKGGSVTAIIPVSVADPFAADRLQALSDVDDKAAEIIGANNYDKGIDALLADAKATIAAATTKAAIDAAVADFATDAKALADAKIAAIADMEELLEAGKLYDQFKTDADSAMATSLNDLKLALSITVVEDIVNAYAKKIGTLMDEQLFYESENEENPGQIYKKIDILEMIDAYQAELVEVIALVTAEGNPATKEAKLEEYAELQKYLDREYKYIVLAIDLGTKYQDIKDHFEDVMRTPIDDIYDMLEEASTLQIVPAPYVEGVLDVDAIGDLLDAIDAKKAAAVTELGSTITEAWMAAHIAEDATNKIDLTTAIERIRTIHTDLETRQGNAAPIVADIAAIDANTTRADIEAIWADLKTWGDGYFFALDTTIDSTDYVTTYDDLYNNLKFEKAIVDGFFGIGIAEQLTNIIWADYDVTQEHLVTYYIPNFQDLLDASINLDVVILNNIVNNIPEYIIYSTTSVDANAAITAAEAARAAFITKYGQEIYDEYCFVDGADTLKADIDAARKEYTELVADANAVLDLIEALPATSEILIKDYKGGEGNKLYDAYEAYKAFADRNSDETTKYTDVITTEAELLACVDAYVVLEYADEKNVISYVKIKGAAIEKIGAFTPDTDAAFREEITQYADAQMAIVNAIAYDDTLAGGKDNFNRIEVLTANLAKVTEAADAVAAKINAAQSSDDLT